MDPLRKELLAYLQYEGTHVSLVDAVHGLPAKLMNKKIGGVPYSPWGLMEHIRRTQHDMLEFITNPYYKEMKWPDDYWPPPRSRATTSAWKKTLTGYKRDLAALCAIVKNPKTDLFAPISHGDGQTIMKEVLQVIDHASYHTGELVAIRRALGAWKKD